MKQISTSVVVGVIRKSAKRYPLVSQRRACLDAGAEQVFEIGPDGTLAEIARGWTTGHRVVVQYLFHVAGMRASAKTKREAVLLFDELVRKEGGEIYEAATGRSSLVDKQRRAMVSDALHAVTRGQQPSGEQKRGRPTRPAATKEQARQIWQSREHTWAQTGPLLRAIGWSQATAYDEFGPRGRVVRRAN